MIIPKSIIAIYFHLFLLLNNTLPLSMKAMLINKTNFAPSIAETPTKYEVFGFAPYWNLDKLENVNFNILTTLAYFDIPINYDGTPDIYSAGYYGLKSSRVEELFQKARTHGTKVVLTVTQMDNTLIEGFLNNENSRQTFQKEIIGLVRKHRLDGVNLDFEYIGNPGDDYRDKYSKFVADFTAKMHQAVPGSKVSVSVLAGSMKSEHLYDIQNIAKGSDQIFMMAYDFATTSSDAAIPTSPLYGHKEGQYWYDISTAVNDFLAVMPSNKLILGLPWYGYDYPVSSPGVKVSTDMGYYSPYWYRYRKYWTFIRYPSFTQTYASVMKNVTPNQSGWDDLGKVNWKAYIDENGIWRMIFLEDEKSLKIKYDFAKNKNLGGVGMWALGFDDGRTELWDLLVKEFGSNIAQGRIPSKLADKI